MNVYALTGGIASGKSEASRKFRELGIPVVDADAIAHRVMDVGGNAYQAVVDAFGNDILTGDEIDRDKLGALVFKDSDARTRLNSLVHPIIGATIGEQLAELAAQGHDTAIVDAALHAENGKLPDGMAGLILVDAPEETRVRRMVEYRGMTREQAESRIAAQTPPVKKRAIADWVIENNDTIEVLDQQVEDVATELQR